jgi:hypothetical protein
MSSPRSLIRCLALLLLLSTGPGPALAEPPAPAPVWDGSTATRLADELERVIGEAWDQAQHAPPQDTVLQQRKRDAAQGSILRTVKAAEAYSRMMRGGATREASEPYFRAIVDDFRAVRATADDVVPSERVEPLLDSMEAIMEKLSRLYDAD